MRRFIGLALAGAVTLVACGERTVETSAPSISTSPTTAIELPAGMPATFPEDLAPADLPASALVPGGTEVTGLWFARTSEGDALVVAWADPRDHALHHEGGVATWRRLVGDPPWRAVYARAHSAKAGVLGVRATIADVTADGSEDALIVQDTGGSGGCGRYLVVDLLTGSAVWERHLCDARVDASRNPVGLLILEAVFGEGDAHCCPTGLRRTVLVYQGDGEWKGTGRELGDV